MDLPTPDRFHQSPFHPFSCQASRRAQLSPHGTLFVRTTPQKGSSMSSKIYVGNLPYSVTDASLHSNFSEFGGVSSAKVMMDRETGRSKGFGFVEMANAEVAQAAISGLHGMSVDGRTIVVNLARPREERSDAGGYTASKRSDVGYGTGGYGGGRY